MNQLDIINGAFESVGAALAWLNVVRIRRDQSTAGVVWQVTAVWSTWGLWNLFYYGSLGHWVSFYAGAALALANAVWVLHAMYYIDRARSLSESLTRAEQARAEFELELARRVAQRKGLRKWRRS